MRHESLADFLIDVKPSFHSESVTTRPNLQSWHSTQKHFLFILTYQGRSFVGFFSHGYSKPPSPRDVYECLVGDAQCGEMTFKEFVESFGSYDEAYQTWMECRKTRDELIDLFGRALYNRLNEVDFSL